ncbi:MAG: cell wall hydrolase [Caulobacteraceae bacterium]
MPPIQLGALAAEVGDFSSDGQARLERSMAPAEVILARRLDPGRRQDLGDRTLGWASLDVESAPNLGFGKLTAEEAERVNSFLPAVGAARGASPFFLTTSGAERTRALLCLTQAIYYEAALEPVEGQEAVAQTVLNRVRNPAFPKTICGVVFQGSQQVTGCQYSFTCDGSRDRPPIAPFWQRAQSVAERAIDGFVMADVGSATSYHADYVFPRWGPTLVKIRQIGAHIFYRFPGPAGRWPSFDQRYGGDELKVSMAGPSAAAILAARAAGALPPLSASPLDTYAAIDPTAPGGIRTRVAGEVIFGRRVPTHDEIARINQSLAAMDGPEPKTVAAQTSRPAFSQKLPIGN